MGITKEQRQEIYDKCIELGVEKLIAEKVAVNATRFCKSFNKFREILVGSFTWSNSPEGDAYWELVYQQYVTPPKRNLSQAEIQFLITVLKQTCNDTVSQKYMYTSAARNMWEICNKDAIDDKSLENFKSFSVLNKYHKYYCQKHKKVSSLLHKLKAMR